MEAWKLAMELVKAVYELTRAFPRDEIYGLAAQLRRAAVSVPSNVAEGAARTGQASSLILNIARGSLSELETQLPISVDLGYIERQHPVFPMVDRVSRLLTGLHKKVGGA